LSYPRTTTGGRISARAWSGSSRPSTRPGSPMSCGPRTRAAGLSADRWRGPARCSAGVARWPTAPTAQNGVDVGEVDGKYGVGLGRQELSPCGGPDRRSSVQPKG
jgi:hypothetical protein